MKISILTIIFAHKHRKNIKIPLDRLLTTAGVFRYFHGAWKKKRKWEE